MPFFRSPFPALPAYNLPLFPSSCSSFMWLSKHSFWRINRNVSILSAHTHTHMPACMYAWPLTHHLLLYLLLVLDSSANFPVDVGIFSVCHLNCLITWIDCEKRATAAAAAAKATVTAIVTATYPFWAAGGVAAAVRRRHGSSSSAISKESHGWSWRCLVVFGCTSNNQIKWPPFTVMFRNCLLLLLLPLRLLLTAYYLVPYAVLRSCRVLSSISKSHERQQLLGKLLLDLPGHASSGSLKWQHRQLHIVKNVH